MIRNLSSLQPAPFKLISSCVSSSSVKPEFIEGISEHFPTRNLSEFSTQRQVEHLGVANCVSEILGHANWNLLYSEDGAPNLYEYHKPSKLSISITHSKIDSETVVFVATTNKGGEKIGLDLTPKNDSRLQRVAPRTMNEKEVDSGRYAEVWALKEAMFKAFGPGIDFKDELLIKVEDILEGKEYVKAEFRGKISTWWLKSEEKFVLALGPC